MRRPALTPLQRQALLAWDGWLAAAGPWQRWSLCLPLVAPGLAELDGPLELDSPRRDDGDTEDQADSLLHRLADALHAQPPMLVVLDLPPDCGVQLAAALARRGLARPLLQIGRWPMAQAVLPAELLVRVLLQEGRSLPRGDGPHACLVLDGERFMPADRPPGDPRADNRYETSGEELPDPPALEAAGIRHILDVRPPTTQLPTGVAWAYARYEAVGITIRQVVVQP